MKAEAIVDDHDYLTCNNGACEQCSAAQKQQCVTAACDGLTASVRDRRDNGGTHQTVRARALDLIRVVVADLEIE
ncbi:hypothetical protein LCGC14_0671230 [marine sediment metagenome]|uniref:Uncharacterized protein n=1 Tax=marine sediment metagenome TaxID=412755 RepID=A0A0F9TYY4_9ZZZZ